MFWKNFFKDTYLLSKACKDTNQGKKDPSLLTRLFYKGKKIKIFLSNHKIFNWQDLEFLCHSVGWECPPFKKIQIGIANSFMVVSLFQEVLGTLKLIGFARVTSDKVFNAIIWDLAVHPEFQGKGLGKILIYQIIQQLRREDIITIALFADSQVTKFYLKLGFIQDPEDIKGMFFYSNSDEYSSYI
uniref:GCN5-like N-acetyltransferase n=1 Tax=Glaucosphaera vacuolata TaxID=38265 RepID=UPI001FCE122B|nr:GCN5-like N-acetyltransferase [Glaucosphaera vacuolata]UNJ18691.1 GCN5-like N-acetyltransferase [Glaucosphaera vacuolata]